MHLPRNGLGIFAALALTGALAAAPAIPAEPAVEPEPAPSIKQTTFFDGSEPNSRQRRRAAERAAAKAATRKPDSKSKFSRPRHK